MLNFSNKYGNCNQNSTNQATLTGGPVCTVQDFFLRCVVFFFAAHIVVVI